MAGRLDVGTADAYGLGYRYMVGFPPTEPFWWGIGGDVQLMTAERDALDATAVSLLGRVTSGHAPPVSIELGVGAARGHGDFQAFGEAGCFLAIIYVELGYSYRLPLGPLDRPDWMSSHQFSLRFHLPVVTRR